MVMKLVRQGKSISLMALLLLVLLTGCASNAPMLLGSAVRNRDLVATGPSLGMSKNRIFRWVSLGYGEAKKLSGFLLDQELTVRNHFFLGGGLMVQPDLTQEWLLEPFVGFGGAVSSSNILIKPSGTSRSKLDSLSIEYQDVLHSVELEANLRSGVVGRFPLGALSLYGLGYVGYESGSYPRFREAYDGVGNLYNVDFSPVTLGYGWGADLQLGVADEGALGLAANFLWSYNHTQSYVSTNDGPAFGPYLIETKPGGVPTETRGVVLSPYLEVKNFRLTPSLAVFGLSNLQLSYRW